MGRREEEDEEEGGGSSAAELERLARHLAISM
jgi:hypothetical protein